MTKSLDAVMAALPEERKKRVEARALGLATSLTSSEKKNNQPRPLGSHKAGR